MPARPPMLETVETVEATQLPGRMAPRQHANDAAFRLRSRGERAFPHGKGFNACRVATAAGILTRCLVTLSHAASKPT